MNIEEYVKFFKAFSHKTRLNIMFLLSEKSLCVCEITEILQTSQPRVSQHLKVLKEAKLVAEEISGPLRIYSLQKDLLTSSISGFISQLDQPLAENEEFSSFVKTIERIGDSMRN